MKEYQKYLTEAWKKTYLDDMINMKLPRQTWMETFQKIADGTLKVDNKVIDEVQKIAGIEHDKENKQYTERRARSKAKEERWFEPGRDREPTHGW